MVYCFCTSHCLWGFCVGLSFGMHYFMSFLVFFIIFTKKRERKLVALLSCADPEGSVPLLINHKLYGFL